MRQILPVFVSAASCLIFSIPTTAWSQAQIHVEAQINGRAPVPNGSDGRILNFIPTGSIAPSSALVAISDSDDILLSANVCASPDNRSLEAKQTWWKNNALSCAALPIARVDDKLPAGNSLGFPAGTMLTSSLTGGPTFTMTAHGNVVMDTRVQIPVPNTTPQSYTSERWILCENSPGFEKLLTIGAPVLEQGSGTVLGNVVTIDRSLRAYDGSHGCSLVVLASVDYGSGVIPHVVLRATRDGVFQSFPGQGMSAPGVPQGTLSEPLNIDGIVTTNDRGDVLIMRPVNVATVPAQTFDAVFRAREDAAPELLVHEQQLYSSGILNGVRISNFNTSYPNQQAVMNSQGEVAILASATQNGNSVLGLWTNRGGVDDIKFRVNTPLTNPGDPSDATFKFTGISEYGILDDSTLHVWGRVASLVTAGQPGAVGAANDEAYFLMPGNSIQILMREGDTVVGNPSNTVLAPDAFVHSISGGSANYGSTPELQSALNTAFISRVGPSAAVPHTDALIVPGPTDIQKLLAVNDPLPGSDLQVAGFNSNTLRLSRSGQLMVQTSLLRGTDSQNSLLYFDESHGGQLVMRKRDPFTVDSSYTATLADFSVLTSGRQGLSDSGTLAAALYLTSTSAGSRRLIASFGPNACPAESSCRADYNRNGSVTVQDIFDFLDAYFRGIGDFNGNCQITVQDIFDFLNAYFIGC